MVDNSHTRMSIFVRYLLSSIVFSFSFYLLYRLFVTFAYRDGEFDNFFRWFLLEFSITLSIVSIILFLPFYYFFTRRLIMEKGVMLEAMGEYQEAMMIASKYATPSQMAKFRSIYEFELKQLNPRNVSTDQVVQTRSSQVQSTTHNQINPTIHIHNTQTQQGPNQNYIQDSVVTDWNQR